jgi:hypothetical protein
VRSTPSPRETRHLCQTLTIRLFLSDVENVYRHGENEALA